MARRTVPAAQAGQTAKMYDFECGSCGHKFESIEKLAAINAGEVECPRCLQSGAKMAISAPHPDSETLAYWRRD